MLLLPHIIESPHNDNNKINGGFSEWTKWGQCSATCGKGFQERIRECNNPEPANGGKYCKGESESVQECTIKECGKNIKIGNSIFSTPDDMKQK